MLRFQNDRLFIRAILLFKGGYLRIFFFASQRILNQESDKLYTTTFWLLCLSHALFAASFTMIIPELPGYLTSIGGEDYKGLIISLFTLTAGLSRPFSGKLTDSVGRVPVMIYGTAVCVIASMLYPVLTSLAGFFFLRFMHGMSTGFKPTASVAYAADILPAHRRGEGMGILGVSMNTGASAAPPFGTWLAEAYSLNVMFYASAFVALLSIIILLRMRETLEERQPFNWKMLRIKKDEIIELRAWRPALVVALVYFSYGIILTIIPDQSDFLGVGNKGWFFAAVTAASLSSRVVLGKWSDTIGRIPVIGGGILGLVVALLVIGTADTVTHLMVGASMMGFSMGAVAPALFAWTVDLVPRSFWGRATGTVYIGLEIGIGSGALFSAWIYQNDPALFFRVFWIAAIITLPGIFALPIWKRKQKLD